MLPLSLQPSNKNFKTVFPSHILVIMLFTQAFLLCLGAVGSYSSPVLISTFDNPTSDSVNAALAPTLTKDTALEVTHLALKPRATPFWTQVGHGVFWTGIGAVWQGSAWLDMIESCEEFYENRKLSKGAACVFSVLTNVCKTAIFAVGSFHATMNFRNIIYPQNNGGGAKRDLNEDFDWTGMWDSMSTDQLVNVRSQWKDSNDLHLHRLDNGTSDLLNSVTIYLSHHEDASVPHYRHITNGTHGTVHSLFGQEPAGNSLSKRGDTFKFSKKIHGVKLSYRHPCIYEQVKSTSKMNSDLISAMTNMVDYMKGNPHSRWNMEWADQQNGNEIMYGTLTIENKPYGKNYESPNFVPDQATCVRT